MWEIYAFGLVSFIIFSSSAELCKTLKNVHANRIDIFKVFLQIPETEIKQMIASFAEYVENKQYSLDLLSEIESH